LDVYLSEERFELFHVMSYLIDYIKDSLLYSWLFFKPNSQWVRGDVYKNCTTLPTFSWVVPVISIRRDSHQQCLQNVLKQAITFLNQELGLKIFLLRLFHNYRFNAQLHEHMKYKLRSASLKG
jgi:hypothetical protein